MIVQDTSAGGPLVLIQNHEGAPFLAGFARSGALFLNPLVPAFVVPTFRKDAKDGAPRSLPIQKTNLGCRIWLPMCGFACSFILRVGTWRERDRNDLCDVRTIAAVAMIDAAIRLEGTPDTAAVVHHYVGILPVAAEFKAGPSIVDEIRIPRPIIHIQVNGLAVSRKIQMLAHPATQPQPDILSAGSAYVSRTLEIGFQVHPAASRRGLNHHIHQIVTAFGVCFSPTLPVRKDVKIPAHVKRPRRENSCDGDHQHAEESKYQCALPKTAQASGTGLTWD